MWPVLQEVGGWGPLPGVLGLLGRDPASKASQHLVSLRSPLASSPHSQSYGRGSGKVGTHLLSAYGAPGLAVALEPWKLLQAS